jgi:hypothetical protein
MKCGVPVIGKVPDIMPEWMSEDNGVWIADKTSIVDYVSDFIQGWLEDNINEEMYTKMESTVSKYSDKKAFDESVCKMIEEIQIKRAESFENQLQKLTNN